MRSVLPLRKRPVDLALVAFFLLNLTLVTYLIDLEQLVIVDPSHFSYPIWPPARMVDLIHWWGRTYDPLLLARPPFWRGAIWLDVVLFGPFYAVATYAFIYGKAWIRVPTLLWSAMLLTNVTLILFEELVGTFASPDPTVVMLANAPWILAPLAALGRMASAKAPFPRAGLPDDGEDRG